MQTNEADHEALREIRDVFEKAVRINDLDLLKPYLAPEFSIVTFTDREFHDFDTFKAQWEKTRAEMLQDGLSFVTLNPERSEILDDIALCRGNAENVLVDGYGNKFTFTSRWTAVCRKIDGKWLIVRGHNSLQPFRNPMVEHAVKKMIKKTAGVALVVGLGVGAAIGLIRRCKR